MPVKRRLRKRREQISGVAWAILNDWPPPERGDLEVFLLRMPDGFNAPDGALAVLWRECSAVILKRWVVDAPGTRPWCWWEFDAPRMPVGTCSGFCWFAAPRQRLGGTGEVYPAYVPTFSKGVPTGWLTVDWTDPPRFESEAAYLRRHGLLLPGEARRLTAADFEPVPLPPPRT